MEWNLAAPDRPTRYLVLKRFGTWDAALEAAGLATTV
jgi:hypothetical protein